jgi:hypothetical protein
MAKIEHSIFALELCLHLDPRGRLRDSLHSYITSHPTTTGTWQKTELLRRVTELLLENDEQWEMGCWDFFDDDARARSDYDMWCNGMITEEGARTEASGIADKYGEPRFLTLTIALLLIQGTPAERGIASLCETPEEQLWRKETFQKILRGLANVDYAGVESDVLYLIPGDAAWGLTPADLREAKFEYLRKIV